MATTSKIFIGDENGQPLELTGADKEAFLEQRAKDQAELDARKKEQDNLIIVKKTAYTKLGLTEEEINAIL